MFQPIDTIAGYWLDGAMRTLDGFKKGADATVNDPPPVTPYRVVFESGKVRLRHYAAQGDAHRTPIVLVYALIKRPFVLDMQKGRSVIEYLTRAGFDVYLTDWLPPNATDTWRGFNAYVNGDLDKAVRFVCAVTRSMQVTVLGYCFGALLSLVYTALHPEKVRNLVTATMPFDMGARQLPIYNIVAQMSEETMELVTLVHGNCPAWMVQSFFTAMAPAHHAIDKYVGLYRNAERDGYAGQFDLFERWMNSDVAMAGQIFREISGDIFKRNLLARGEFEINGRKVETGQVRCPLLNVVADYDDVVHPRSSLGLIDCVSSSDRRNLTFPTGHVGAMVSGAAHKQLWPQIGAWLGERSK
ncbi:MAG: alpha/beta fold hydrolase [Candidatus Binataceae bacterium]